MNLCVNCKHHLPVERPGDGYCTREQKTSPVDGRTFFYHAETLRAFEHTDCGPEGKFFEPLNPEPKPHDNPNPIVQDG